MKKIAILGTGSVGQTLASKFVTLGYDVILGTRSVSEKLSDSTKDSYGNPPFREWHAANNTVKLATFREAAASAEVLVNATKGAGSIEALKLADLKSLKGKILIDVANPLDFSKGMPPILHSELANSNSLGEEIQKNFPDVKVVKTLNTMWCGLMVNPALINGGDHNVFLCGNDSDAKAIVKGILKSFGWHDGNILDLGGIAASRGTEMYLPLWLSMFGATGNGAFNIKIVS
ncbi:MAG: NAD(P)-binding domain-containing protein [Bacteroidales bacterium]|nr:NAD(P)-binding domain-containing protein [Bacteroidales bacterium]